jgi:PAS domain S-box-containing protein
MSLDAPSPETDRFTPGMVAVLDAALDAVIAIDGLGKVRYWNSAAERIFGYSSQEVVGREMAELIVPERHREAHRRGVERLVGGGVPVLIGQRVEIDAHDAGGREFPVELTVTSMPLAAPLFLGYVRDISARVEAERQLRESRHRLLEAAYATRRRFERDLHDGAQQRLIGAGIALQLLRAKVDDGSELAELIDEAREELTAATAELRELARGLHPAVLTQGGLRPALRALTGRAPIPVTVEGVPEERLPLAVETTVYFTLAEGLTNVARHSGAAGAAIVLQQSDGLLRVTLTDDGRGGARIGAGSGLDGLRDRAVALDGRLWVEDAESGGTRLVLEVPCEQ